MIRVRLADSEKRQSIATFFRHANMVVTFPEGDAHTLCIDFAAFDFDEATQLRIVTRMLAAWQTERNHAILDGAEIAIA